MSRPRFSVIVISYNQAKYIEQATGSVLATSMQNIELICVDDGSDDGTARMLADLAASDHRVRVLSMRHTGRPAAARNAGLAIAQGDYVCFLDGDDLFDIRKLDLLLDAIESRGNAVDVIFHDYVDFYDGESPREARPRIRASAAEQRLLHLATNSQELTSSVKAYDLDAARLVGLLIADGFMMNTDSVCIRKQHIVDKAVAFPEDRVVGEDNTFWLECVRGARVLYLDEALSYWRKRRDSLSQARTSAKQRELVQSMHEQLQLVLREVDEFAIASARQRIYEETVEIGWLLEKEGAWLTAVLSYLRTATNFRRLAPIRRAAVALVRPLLRWLGAIDRKVTHRT